jgi:type IV fimbrial biogenesis protein FimT
MRKGPSRISGFTAVELLVVIAIAGILAALAMPTLRSLLNTQKSRSIAYDLLADLTFARSEAISRGHNVQVQSASANTTWIGGWAVNDVSVSPPLQLKVQQCSGTPCQLATGVNFTSNVNQVTFDRNGRTSTNASFDITPNDAATTPDQKRCV